MSEISPGDQFIGWWKKLEKFTGLVTGLGYYTLLKVPSCRGLPWPQYNEWELRTPHSRFPPASLISHIVPGYQARSLLSKDKNISIQKLCAFHQEIVQRSRLPVLICLYFCSQQPRQSACGPNIVRAKDPSPLPLSASFINLTYCSRLPGSFSAISER